MPATSLRHFLFLDERASRYRKGLVVFSLHSNTPFVECYLDLQEFVNVRANRAKRWITMLLDPHRYNEVSEFIAFERAAFELRYRILTGVLRTQGLVGQAVDERIDAIRIHKNRSNKSRHRRWSRGEAALLRFDQNGHGIFEPAEVARTNVDLVLSPGLPDTIPTSVRTRAIRAPETAKPELVSNEVGRFCARILASVSRSFLAACDCAGPIPRRRRATGMRFAALSRSDPSSTR